MPQRILILVSLSLCCYQATPLTDTISQTQPLKDGQVLTSGENNIFSLGFFSPGNSTQNRYVGLWYNKVAIQTVVWVANRDRPINGSDGILSISDNGNLLLSSNNSIVWSTNISYERRPTNEDPPKAQLLDSGNLILAFGSQNTVWQSFDYPTHVFLPGMKLGLDRITGFNRYLSSWRSSEDPGHGNYTFRVNLEGGGSPEFFLYKDGSVPVWRSGPWVGERWSGVPEMTRGYIFNYTFVDTRDDVYAMYKIMNTSIVSMFLLDGESGTVLRKTWHETSRQWIKFWEVPKEDCDEYANCGGFGLCNPNNDQFKCSCLTGYKPKSPRDWYLRDGSEGCVRDVNVSMCRNGEGLLKLGNVKVPDTSSAKTNMNMNLEECREECLNNCSCSAFTTATDGGNAGGSPRGCIMFHGDLMDARLYEAGGGQDLYFRVDAVELAKSLGKSKGDNHFNTKLFVILLVCTILTFSFIASLACWLYRKNRRELKEQEERCLWLEEVEESNSNSNSPVFRFSTIVAATQKFDPTNLLGEGGFGSVYKGKLSSGVEIAVKRLSKFSGQGINEFKNEVRLISKLQHRNLVKTLGCCVRGEEKMLVYEFLPNRSLDQYIFEEEKKSLLDWSKRHEIIIGIARGVLYLHQDSRLKIIHRDLKASNILLDAEMTPKISDFGMARIFGNEQIEANTNRVVGTYGYMSPEYAMEGLFSIKSDVFSFGVIVLEIIGGQRSSGYYNDRLSTNLSGYAWKLWQDGNAMELVDKSIVSTVDGYEDEVLRCIHIGLLCVQENPNERPTMLEVTFMLSNKSELPPPKEPAFIIRGRNHHNTSELLSSSTEAHSVNELTVTIVDGR